MSSNFRNPLRIARRLTVMPRAVRELKSWPRFMCNYALGLVPKRPYRFRSGALLLVGRGVEHVPIVEVFVRRDYGDIADDTITILDIGASIGVFTVFAATLAPKAIIHAYEPSSEAFRLLTGNLRLNGLENRVKAFNVAVAGDSGSRILYTSGEGLFFPATVRPNRDVAFGQTRVPCTTLMDIMAFSGLDEVALLKLDVEGAEYEVLRATSPEYLNRILEVRMEAHDLNLDDCNVEALKDFLRSQGFTIICHRTAEQGVHNVWAKRETTLHRDAREAPAP